MADLLEKINNDLKQAMRDKSVLKLAVLRMLAASLKNKKIELGKDLNNEQITSAVKSEIKKRKDAIVSYKQGNRLDLANKEEKEIKILNKYMPAQMSEKEIEKIIKETISGLGQVSAKDFGRIMGQVMSKAGNKADGQAVSSAVKKILTS